jgi:DNA-directed RNA polymerase subunit M/transcription elongation factor TFIIS
MENVIDTLQSKIIRSEDSNDDKNNKSCVSLLLEKSNQIAEISMKVENLTVELQQLRRREGVNKSDTDSFSEPSHANDESLVPSQHQNISEEQGTTNNLSSGPLEAYRRKSEALERSLATLKHKMAEREIKSAKNFRLMNEQLSLVESDRNRRMVVQQTLQDQVTTLEYDIRCKDRQIWELQSQLRSMNVSQPTSMFRHDHCGNQFHLSHKEEDVWDDKDGAVPPILVAASRDEDDTASETDSRYDASEDL